MEDLLGVARNLRESGTGLEGMLSEMRSRGASIIDSLKIVRDVERVSLGQAKVIVDGSATWADRRSSNDKLRDEAVQAWSEADE